MIGRIKERKKLDTLLKSQRSEFLAVTGRRRVGKTYLIDSYLGSHYCFSMTGIQNGNTQNQLLNFGVKLAEYQSLNTPKAPPNWQSAFLQLKNYLRQLPKDQKQVLFFDELPWIYTPRSNFVQLLAHFWNDYLSKQQHFILVVCGSATSWITQKVINDPGGLHNRLTENIHLRPFSLAETKLFLESKNIRLTDQETAKIYMALGGIPFYLENIRKGESFATAIERISFAPTGLLHNEYNNLYQALFKNAEVHLTIVQTLAKRQHGATKKTILKLSGLKANGSFQRAMNELMISDFIEPFPAFGKSKRDIQYKLIDEFSIFYHRFIRQVRKYTPGIWQQIASGQSYKSWAGLAFESLCFKHIQNIKSKLGISAVYAEISTLNIAGNAIQNGFQIDLIIDRKDQSINICEIKFTDGPYTIDKKAYEAMNAKRQQFLDHTKTKKQLFITYISANGLTENKYTASLVDAEITLEDLFTHLT